MNDTEAQKILNEHVRRREQRCYDELSRLVVTKHVETFEETGPSGTVYQIQIQYFWDASPGGAVRVLGAIDDGGIRAYKPLCCDTLVYPERT